MRTIRCSSIPALMHCGPSQDVVPLMIERANPEATLGTAAHAGAAYIVQGVSFDEVALAMRYGVDLDELRMMLAVARKVWRELAPAFPNPQTEVYVECVAVAGILSLTGHIDVASMVGEQPRRGRKIHLLDWKTGRKEETDYYPQLIGYAACLILGEDDCEEVTATVVWLRSQQVETYTFDRKAVVEFMGMLADHIADGRFRTGGHCGNCARSHDCPALIAQSRRDMAIFRSSQETNEIAQGWIDEIDGFEVVDVRRRVKVLEKFAESLDEAVRRRIERSGPLASGDGYQLELVEENGKRVLDTLKAWDIAAAKLDDSEMAGCLTFSASRLDDAIAKKAPPRQGKAAKEAFRLELEAAGAIEQPKVKKLREVRLVRALPAKRCDGGHAEPICHDAQCWRRGNVQI